MPKIRTRYSLEWEDVERIREAIVRCGVSGEGAINDYLHNTAGEMIAQSITKFIPRSDRKKVHARDSKWYAQSNFNLAVGISNSQRGKNSAYYLYYVATGTGTSKKNGPNDFMEKGLEKEYDNVVNGVIQKLLENIDKELK